ncbi:MAG: hypothetical protein ACXWJX_14145 [Limisphaerales bacterium]
MLKRVIVIDEAGNVFDKKLTQNSTGFIPWSERGIRELRATGTGILGGLQVVSDASDSFTGNVDSIFCFRSSNPKEANTAAQLLTLPEACSSEIQKQPVGIGYFRSDGFSRPVKVHTRNFDPGPRPSNEAVTNRMAAEFAVLESETSFAPVTADETQGLSYLEFLREAVESKSAEESDHEPTSDPVPQVFGDQKKLLQEIKNHPDASVTEHYQNLKWSAWRGNRVKEQLLILGLIESQRQQSATGGRPKEILTIKPKAKSLL